MIKHLLAAFLALAVSTASFAQSVVTPAAGPATAASAITGIVGPANGGTGVANNAAATTTRSGSHALTITTTGTTGVTLPTSGTLLNNSSSQVISTSSTSGTTLALTNSSSGGGTITLYSTGSANGEGAGNWILSGGTKGFAPAVASNTTASAANVFVNSSTGELARSTSSIRYKHDVVTLPAGQMFDSLRPVSFRSLAKSDDPARVFMGFIAEEVAAISPSLATMQDGKPNNIDDRAVLAVTVVELQRVKAQLFALAAVFIVFAIGTGVLFARRVR